MSNTGYTWAFVNRVNEVIKKAVINQDELTEMALICMLSGGHTLIEGVPGLAKTLWVRSLAKALDIGFKRVQFTSDLMPADITGSKVYNMDNHTFELKKGPLFTNFFLADEINRTPPKTQSALLEVMEERSITIDGETHIQPDPFMVIATQNPLEYEGTYPLPEALTDRFMMKLNITYPGVAAEKKILYMYDSGFTSQNIETADIKAAASAEDIQVCREEIRNVRVDESILNYIVSIVETTRRVNSVALGASPRGTVALFLNAKAYAARNNRDYCIPDDVVKLAPHILCHRIILKPEAQIDGLTPKAVLHDILSRVKAPR